MDINSIQASPGVMPTVTADTASVKSSASSASSSEVAQKEAAPTPTENMKDIEKEASSSKKR